MANASSRSGKSSKSSGSRTYNRSSKTKSKSRKNTRKKRRLSDAPVYLRKHLIALAISLIVLLCFAFIKFNRSLMNFLTAHITSPIKHGLSYVCDFAPIAMTEIFCVILAILVIVFIVRSVIRIRNHIKPSKVLLVRLILALTIFVSAYDLMTLLWGFNYYTSSFCVQNDISDRGCRAEELYTILNLYVNRANELAPLVNRDANGVYIMDRNQIFSQAQEVYDHVVKEFPCLEGPKRSPKPMISSKFISYLNFTGFFCPFTGETLINVDQPDYLVPVTILHEISHQRDIASEQECNFIAIMAGSDCGNIDFEYSACMFAYIHLSNALYKADKGMWEAAVAKLSEQAKIDNRINSEYWAQFNTPVKTVSQKTYTKFIEGYGESDGLASYEKCVDLLIAYYYDNHPEILRKLRERY